MDVLSVVAAALKVIENAREVITEVTSAINDGKLAVKAETLAELNDMLEREGPETQAAYDAAKAAIAEARK